MSVLYSVRNISFAYPSSSRKVLDDVSLDICEGDALTILGRNGAGKSTLLHCLLGLKHPQSGEIRLAGRSLRDMTEREIASEVGYVPQSHTPAFEHTVSDFVQMGFAARIGLFSRPGNKERSAAAAILAEMGIEYLADRPYTQLSGGEQQQAIIARAIVMRPRIVLFDEPTAHLDFGNQIKVLRIIRQFTDKGYAVVITTHNPDHALLLGGRAAIFDAGGRVRSGRTGEILTEETLKSVYGSDLSLQYIAALGRQVCVYPNL
jgi:iron complex transport system ATP-binding protein